MPTIQFTDAWLKSDAPVPERGQTLWTDRTKLPRGRALGLLVGATGSKGWRVTYYEGGKPKSAKLGFYAPGVPGHLSLQAARDKAAAYVPPSTKVEAQTPASPTLRMVVDDYLKRHVAGLRTRYEVTRKLERYIVTDLADVPFAQIGRREVAKLLDAVEDVHGAIVADSVLVTLRSLMAWYADRHDDYNPPRLKPRSTLVRRERVLSDNEIKALLQATADGSAYSALLQFLLLTGARRAKALELQHGDIDARGVWTINTAVREKPNAGKLVLPQLVLDIVASQPRVEGSPVFAGPSGAGIRDLGRLKARVDQRMRAIIPDMPGWVVHDLRRTFRTKLSQLGVAEEIGERCLGHVLPGIVRTYNQHRYEAEMADALQKLSAHVALLVNPPDNVVLLRR